MQDMAETADVSAHLYIICVYNKNQCYAYTSV